MVERRASIPMIGREVAFRSASFNDAENTVDIVFTTGAKVRRQSWSEGAYDEELVVEPGSVRLDRLNAGAPFLNTHSDYDLADVIGSVVPGSARIENGQGIATILLSRRDDVRGIVQDIRDGVIRNISVGYRYHRIEKTDGQDGDPALWRIVDWEPLEISAVPIPADPGAQFRSASNPNPPTAKNGPQMTETTNSQQADPAGADALVAEHARAVTITDLAQRVGMQGLARSAVARGISVDQFRAEMIRAIEARENAVDTQSGFGPNMFAERQPNDSRAEKRAEAITTALLHRADPAGFTMTDDAKHFRGLSLIELARSSLDFAGVDTRGLTKMQLASDALRLGGLHSTSDFPAILANVANKTLRAGYEAAPQTWRPFTRETTLPDFKETSRIQLGEAPQLEKVLENGEFKRGTIGEGKEAYSVFTFGKVVGITRQAIINDDLNAFTRIPRAFGIQAANLESDLVWAQIIGNPIMGDGKTLFHADHGNIGAAAGIDVISISQAFEAMRLQRGLDGKTFLNLVPRCLIVPVAASLKAQQLLTSITPAMVATQTSNIVPDYIRNLIPISEPRLDGGFLNPVTGATVAGSRFNWFVAADPAMNDTVEIGYLEGNRGVYTETRQGFDIDGIETKVRIDVGAKVIDWRSFYKNPAGTL